MSQNKNLYEILGVSKTASIDEIKKTYKKLAMKWHPDRHAGKTTEKEAQKKFPEIQAAYNVLSDPNKKAEYDQGLAYGQNRNQQYSQNDFQWGHSAGGNFEDLFKEAFNQRTRQHRQQLLLKVPFHMADTGGSFQYGRGQTIKIEAGTPDGMQVMANQDIITIEITYPSGIKRLGDDIYVDVELPLIHSLLGCKMRFDHWAGKTFEIEWPNSTVTGKKLRLKGQGARKYKSLARGDLYLVAVITADPPLSQDVLDSLKKSVGTPSILKTKTNWNS